MWLLAQRPAALWIGKGTHMRVLQERVGALRVRLGPSIRRSGTMTLGDIMLRRDA